MNLSKTHRPRLTRDPIVIVGAGLAGSATAYHLTQLIRRHRIKRDVIIIEQFDPLHDLGSSGGETRLTRFANAEGQELTDSAIGTVDILERMQRDIRSAKAPGMSRVRSILQEGYGSTDLIQRNGTLIIGMKGKFAREAHGVKNFVQTTIDYARKQGIEHEEIDGHDIQQRFPGMRVPQDQRSDTEAYFEPRSGTLFIERIVAAQLCLAMNNGAQLVHNTRVTGLRETHHGIRVSIEGGEPINAAKVVICAGPWIGQFFRAAYAAEYVTQRQTPVWFGNTHPNRFSVKTHPNFIRFFPTPDGDVDYFYGISGTKLGVKVAQEMRIATPMGNAGMDVVYPGEITKLYNKVAPYVWDINARNAHGKVCYYTTTPDSKFRIGPHPDMFHVYGFSACSGQGAKNIPALAQAMAREVLDLAPSAKLDLRAFGWRQPILTAPLAPLAL